MEAWLNACCDIKYALIVKILNFFMGGGGGVYEFCQKVNI